MPILDADPHANPPETDPDVIAVLAALEAAGVTNPPEADAIRISIHNSSVDEATAFYLALVEQSGDPSGHAAFVKSHDSHAVIPSKSIRDALASGRMKDRSRWDPEFRADVEEREKQ